MEIKIAVEVEPMPAPRPRLTRSKIFMPAVYQQYKQLLGVEGLKAMHGLSPTTKELSANLIFRRNFKTDSRRFGDLDNLIKGVLDALNGIVYADDALVTKIQAEKTQDKKAGVEATFYFDA